MQGIYLFLQNIDNIQNPTIPNKNIRERSVCEVILIY